MKEPKGTRMQVVKGFADLLSFLSDKLGPSTELLPRCKYVQPRRDEIECHWPKWRKNHWVCCLVHKQNIDARDIPPLVIFKLYPDGVFYLLMHDRDGSPFYTESSGLTVEGEPEENKIRAYFQALAYGPRGDIIADHLISQTRLQEEVA